MQIHGAIDNDGDPCSCASTAGAYTVSFDEVPAGSNVQVYLNTDTPFLASSAFTIEDHSAASGVRRARGAT